MLYAHYVTGWDWYAAMICGIALSTTSVAVVYAVMIETGLNETDFGKLILAACFITDLGTVVALGACFANYDRSLLIFALVAVAVLWLAPRFVRWFFAHFSTHVSEPGVKMVFFMLFGLGALATLSNSEAVLPAYMVGLALAGIFAYQRDTIRRLRTTVFAFLTPFYFLNAGMKVHTAALGTGLGLIAVLLLVKLITKTIGVWPLTRLFRFGFREGTYTTLLMSTGLTFGTISALFGLTHGYTDPSGAYHSYINQEQYSILVTVVIGSAIVPTVIAQKFFRPDMEPAVVVEVDSSGPEGVDLGPDGEVAVESRPASPPRGRLR
jgi:Kef-type K+ transport system membrane component KefB